MWVLLYLASLPPSHEGSNFSFVTFAVGPTGSFAERVYYLFTPEQADQVAKDLAGFMKDDEYLSLKRSLENFKRFPGFTEMKLQCYTGEEARMQHFVGKVAMAAMMRSLAEDEDEESGGQPAPLRN